MSTVTNGMVNWKINGIPVNTSIKCSTANYNNHSSRNISYIVMHYTGNKKDTAKSNAAYFKNGARSASAHFFVDDSEIYQSVELRDIAWHCGAKTYKHTSCRNANSIGIEMCCTSGNYKIGEKTMKNSAFLCARICQLIGITASQVDKYVLRHYDITGKTCPAQFVNNSSEWTTFKTWVKNILNYGDIKNSSAIATKSSTPSTKTPTVAKPTIKMGSKGTQVNYLQKDLNYLSIKGADNKKLTVDGSAGANTIHAVKQFQKKYKLTVDGIYGNNSYSKMNALLK